MCMLKHAYNVLATNQVHYVMKYNFVQNYWRVANLYIFGILRAYGFKKIMLAFA
jgi:hypothetical protein